MEGVVNVEWHGQDYLHLKWHVVCSGLVTTGIDLVQDRDQWRAYVMNLRIRKSRFVSYLVFVIQGGRVIVNKYHS